MKKIVKILVPIITTCSILTATLLFSTSCKPVPTPTPTPDPIPTPTPDPKPFPQPTIKFDGLWTNIIVNDEIQVVDDFGYNIAFRVDVFPNRIISGIAVFFEDGGKAYSQMIDLYNFPDKYFDFTLDNLEFLGCVHLTSDDRLLCEIVYINAYYPLYHDWEPDRLYVSKYYVYNPDEFVLANVWGQKRKEDIINMDGKNKEPNFTYMDDKNLISTCLLDEPQPLIKYITDVTGKRLSVLITGINKEHRPETVEYPLWDGKFPNTTNFGLSNIK